MAMNGTGGAKTQMVVDSEVWYLDADQFTAKIAMPENERVLTFLEWVMLYKIDPVSPDIQQFEQQIHEWEPQS